MSFAGKFVIGFLNLFPYVKGLKDRINHYKKYISFQPGHYYSPLVDTAEFIELRKSTHLIKASFPEIGLNEENQLALLKEFKKYYNELPFNEKPSDNLRYYYDNDFFSYSDAIVLFCMIRNFKPKRIIEIGSGFSSALLLDTNQHFFNSEIELTFIDPNPERLKSLLSDSERVDIVNIQVQKLDPEFFKSLEEGDFLLIDTSHVSKSGSDVNYIYFNILPFINKGVQIHIHDIFFPFEYPDKWIIKENRSWNELYLLRAFLAYSSTFEITYYNSFMEEKYKQYIQNEMPLFLKRTDIPCGGIWINKIL